MLRGAVIGTGKIALTAHMPAYEILKDKIQIIAACDINSDSRKLFSKQYPDITVYSATEEMLENVKPDFVDICVPPVYHHELIKRFAKKVPAVLCEKPFAVSLDDAVEQRNILKEYKTVFMPCHQYKFSPIWINFKRLIDMDLNDARALLQFNVNRTEADISYTVSNPYWRTDPGISGGGILTDTGIHYLYLILWMLGKPVKVFSAMHKLKHTDYNVEDTAVAIIESEQGLAQINLTWAADRRDNSAQIIFGGSSMYYNGSELISYTGESVKKIPVPDASDKSTYISYYVSLIEEFVKRINEKSDCSDWIEEAYESILLLRTCYRSAEIGRTINLKVED